MENNKFKQALDYLLNIKYCNATELEYNKEVGILFSPYEYKQFLAYKDGIIDTPLNPFDVLPLKTFNSKHIFFALSNDLASIVDSYLALLVGDINSTNSLLSHRHTLDFYKSRLYSEIEGSVNVENVPTTRRRLKELLENNMPPKDKNDIIIKNMDRAIKFVHTLPEFNKDNLFHVYTLLSENCLADDDKLRPNEYYRYDSVQVGRYHGCPYSLINECMDSLFDFVKSILYPVVPTNKQKVLNVLLPHICHYYLLYIHPYFDYNGRTARMVSYWIYLLTKQDYMLPVISEAINQTKAKYYRSIEESRDSNNDISYFLKYIFTISIDYALCYMNLENIDKYAKNKNVVLSDTEMNYIKKIIISCKGKFTYSDFLKACDIEMSKQGAFKLLNKFSECGILISTMAPSKAKLFEINNKVVIYEMKNL